MHAGDIFFFLAIPVCLYNSFFCEKSSSHAGYNIKSSAFPKYDDKNMAINKLASLEFV